jgi:hypothetical protein
MRRDVGAAGAPPPARLAIVASPSARLAEMPKRLPLILVAAVILAALWSETGWEQAVTALRTLEPLWLAAAIALFLPQLLLLGGRWALLVGAYQPISLGRATADVLASSALNVIVPSNLGDMAKGACLRRDLPGGDAATGLVLAGLEKALDTAALALVLAAGALLAPPTRPLGWTLLTAGLLVGGLAALPLSRPVARRLARAAEREPHGVRARLSCAAGRGARVILHVRRHPRRFAAVFLAAVGVWLLTLVQFWCALRAAGGEAGIAFAGSRVAMGLLVGFAPVSFAGIGTRDAALVYFLGPAVGHGPALALGLFATLRYVVYAVAGLPFIPRLPRAAPAAAPA